jgi:molybdenum cofactor cytidylyltransferase
MNAGHHRARIDVVMLAAGPSRRMGRPKQALPYKETTLLRHLVREALASQASGVTVVIGAWAEHSRHELDQLAARIVQNEDWEEGMSSSLRRGLRSLSADTQACLIMLCDQPLISRFSLNRLIEAYRTGDFAIVASEYDGVPGVPAIYDRSVFPSLLGLSGDQGARQFLRSTDLSITRVPVPEAALDLDTPEEYTSFLKSRA